MIGLDPRRAADWVGRCRVIAVASEPSGRNTVANQGRSTDHWNLGMNPAFDKFVQVTIADQPFETILSKESEGQREAEPSGAGSGLRRGRWAWPGRSDRRTGWDQARPRPEMVVEDVPLAEATRSRYLNYALSVITSRALPDVRDGLKPVQRRILYAMYADLRVTADGRYIKSAAVVGEVMKSYHPHGDQSIYDALVRMAQSFSLRYPLVEGYGNFGSIDGDPPAAMRYTECRLTPIAQELLTELRDQTVDHRPNYASTTEEPDVLPAQFPNLLVNGAAGIAVGMATNIPPHNLHEVCAALDVLLNDRETPVEKLTHHILAPDFPTGGVILNSPAEILQIYATGQGAIKLRGTYEVDSEKANQVLITSIPYGIEKDALVARIGELIGKGQVPQLTNVKDLSTDDVRIALELRPGANVDAALAYLFKNTPLQTNFNVNLTCLLPAVGAEVAVPARLDLKSMLVHFPRFPARHRDPSAPARVGEPAPPDSHPRRFRDRLQRTRRGDPDHPRQQRQARRSAEVDGSVWPERPSGRRDPGNQALSPRQTGDPGTSATNWPSNASGPA